MPEIHDLRMESYYHLMRNGKMQALNVKSDYTLATIKPVELQLLTNVLVEATPADRQVAPRITLSLEHTKGDNLVSPLVESAPAVEIGERHLILNPLHPVRRFPSLHANQRWQVTMIDPLAAFSALPRTIAKDRLPDLKFPAIPSAFVLEARVQSDEEIFVWEQAKEVPCRIVQIGVDPLVLSMRLWVSVHDGMLMQQEVNLVGDTWVMVRRTHPQFPSSAKVSPQIKP
jgi:hypothetical protein